jgi:hypothetical protein
VAKHRFAIAREQEEENILFRKMKEDRRVSELVLNRLDKEDLTVDELVSDVTHR